LIQKGQSGRKRHLNDRLVQGPLGHTLVVLTFSRRGRKPLLNEVSLYRIRKTIAFVIKAWRQAKFF
jgi:hypothetical protein